MVHCSVFRMDRARQLKAVSVVLLLLSFAGAQTSPRKPAPPATGNPVNACLGYAQHPELRPQGKGQQPAPTVTFRLQMASFNPSYYGVAVESTGQAAYVSEPQVTPDSGPGEPYIVKFTISDATRQRIFDLARKVNFFQGDFDYRKGKIANTGAKTLSYADGMRCTQTAYNWSENADVQQLTAIFQDISNTMEFGRRLAFLHRFDKLGLDAELKSMEENAKARNLEELQAIAPVLRSIAEDYAVMHLARARAERLLAQIPPAGNAQ